MTAPYDPVNFIPADLFFPTVPQFKTPTEVVSVQSSEHKDNPDPLRYAVLITLKGVGGDPDPLCLIQFVTPQIWRIRFNPRPKEGLADFTELNSRTIVIDKFSDLVDHLKDEYHDSMANDDVLRVITRGSWTTSFSEREKGTHWVLSSQNSPGKSGVEGRINTTLHILNKPFRLYATRALHPLTANPTILKSLGLSDHIEQVIWQTTSQAFAYSGHPEIGIINNTVMNMTKPGSSQYVGFGEQGGNTVLRKPTFMNFFCFDNFNYKKVYQQGALDAREPLYHSTPYWLELNNAPGFCNVTGFMIDNYSQVAVDLGKTQSGTIAVATRFGMFDAYILTADDTPKMIWQYSSIVGRPKLKPRFILGHHQGCYGYKSTSDVDTVVRGYERSGIPLDGMHLDVDFQDRYRTFTVNGINFPNVKSLLTDLRSRGVKCCTNITPILTLRENDQDQYSTLRDFWDFKDKLNEATNLLVVDKRYEDGMNGHAPECFRYDGGDDSGKPAPLAKYYDPNSLALRNEQARYADWVDDPLSSADNYIFIENDPNKPKGNYNSGYPFHGGVKYGEFLGAPGYYPDLNRAVAREVWGKQYQYLFDAGLEFVWQDMTTPAVSPVYGDMLGFPSRLLVSDDAINQDPNKRPPPKTAIELWSLYSYNLHKATYNGLGKLKGRENKRNFIIGRGSQTGMHRFAGLWTGDNGSSWDFWRISVAQVLALGYSGLTIAGVDMGGFTADPADPKSHWCDPELLIRWYAGACLLPWYRNHYMHHFSKLFQEPWQYSKVPHNPAYTIPQNQYWLYYSVKPLCRYYVRLCYSLIQALYDVMFENLIGGLPLARSMLITDPYDTTLLNENARFLDNQYLLGNNILVSPITDPLTKYKDVYLPQTDEWYPSNLRSDTQGYGSDAILKNASNLAKAVPGGTNILYYCEIRDAVANPETMPYVTPMFIRAGSIIPQVDVRQTINENDKNAPTLHLYPGAKAKQTSYSMYLDDGVSLDSAPAYLPQYKYASILDSDVRANGETATVGVAKSNYRELRITQSYKDSSRLITLFHPWNNYDAAPNIGDTYNLAVWVLKETAPNDAAKVSVSYVDQSGAPVYAPGLGHVYNESRGVLTLAVPVCAVPSVAGLKGKTPGLSLTIKIRGLD